LSPGTRLARINFGRGIHEKGRAAASGSRIEFPARSRPASLLARRGGLPVRHQYSSGSRARKRRLPRILHPGFQKEYL